MKDGASYRYKGLSVSLASSSGLVNIVLSRAEVVTRYRLTVWVENEQFLAFPIVNISSFRPYMTLGLRKLCRPLSLEENELLSLFSMISKENCGASC